MVYHNNSIIYTYPNPSYNASSMITVYKLSILKFLMIITAHVHRQKFFFKFCFTIIFFNKIPNG